MLKMPIDKPLNNDLAIAKNIVDLLAHTHKSGPF
jgi:hypothetical protein